MRLHTGITVDLRQGWLYVVKRRAKLVAFAVTLAAAAVAQGVLHGTAEHVAELVIAVAGLGTAHQVPNAEKRR